MTKEEKLRQIDLLMRFNDNEELIELLDLVGQEYSDTVLDRINIDEPYGPIATMQAGVRAFRNAITQDLKVLNDKYNILLEKKEDTKEE